MSRLKILFGQRPDLTAAATAALRAGAVTQHTEYLPFGEPLIEQSAASADWQTSWLFNSKEYDPETGLSYYGARYYDPALALWLSPDCFISFNCSSYKSFKNNPIRYFDPDGNWEWDCNRNLISNDGDSPETLASFLNIPQSDASAILKRNGIEIGAQNQITPNSALRRSSIMTIKRPEASIVVKGTWAALQHYYRGNGESVDVGFESFLKAIQSDRFRENLKSIYHYQSKDKGSFAIDLTKVIFHIVRTSVDFTVNHKSDYTSVTFKIFMRDGFWDPDFISEKYIDPESYLGKFINPIPDGKGPNLEKGGTPYDYLPYTWTIYFPPKPNQVSK